MIAHACNPCDFRGGDKKDQGLRPSRQKVSETPISINKTDLVAYNVIPVMWEE
jgi:hypothetical protein